MRIGMIAPPWFPLPPQRYGGIESVVSLLTEGLVARGHEVTLFASGDSETRAALSYVFARAPFVRVRRRRKRARRRVKSACAATFGIGEVNSHTHPPRRVRRW